MNKKAVQKISKEKVQKTLKKPRELLFKTTLKITWKSGSMEAKREETRGFAQYYKYNW